MLPMMKNLHSILYSAFMLTIMTMLPPLILKTTMKLATSLLKNSLRVMNRKLLMITSLRTSMIIFLKRRMAASPSCPYLKKTLHYLFYLCQRTPKNNEQDIYDAESPDDDSNNNQKHAKIEGSNFHFFTHEKTAAQSLLFMPKNDEEDIYNAQSPDDDSDNNQKCVKIEGFDDSGCAGVPEPTDDASSSSYSSGEVLKVFDQKHIDKEQSMKDTYHEFCVAKVWKHQALLE
jgi:hypothetical protein